MSKARVDLKIAFEQKRLMAYQENHVGWTDRDRVWVAVKIKGTPNLKYFLHGEWWLAGGLRGALRKPAQALMFTDRIIHAGSRFWPIEDPSIIKNSWKGTWVREAPLFTEIRNLVCRMKFLMEALKENAKMGNVIPVQCKIE